VVLPVEEDSGVVATDETEEEEGIAVSAMIISPGVAVLPRTSAVGRRPARLLRRPAARDEYGGGDDN
jgi:hypothetical protein